MAVIANCHQACGWHSDATLEVASTLGTTQARPRIAAQDRPVGLEQLALCMSPIEALVRILLVTAT
jgi:hypothetical protein